MFAPFYALINSPLFHVIGTNSMVLIQAACLRIPAIALLLRSAFRSVKPPDENCGWWPPCDNGSVLAIYDAPTEALVAQMANSIDLLTLKPYSMRAHQERALPRPTKMGEGYEVMRDAILAL